MSQSIDESSLKAIWIGKFTYFIEWPANADFEDTVFIATVKNDDFEGKLEKIYRNKKIQDKFVSISHYKKISECKKAHILFLPEMDNKNLKEILEYANKEGILVIGATNGYSEQGVHINFYKQNQKIRFEINETAMKNSGFFVSFRLLNIAKVTQPISTK